METIMGLDIFMSHEAPKLPISKQYVGRGHLYSLVKNKQPVLHIYGHCHHPHFWNKIGNTIFMNVDGRVLIINPKKKS